MPSKAGICRKKLKRTTLCKDRISALPEDLLLLILFLLPIKDAVTTMILSKRWRFVWTMLPKLDYTESKKGGKRNPEKNNVWDFLDKLLQLHKAPSLEILRIQIKQQCPVDVDIGKWVLNAVDRCVRELILWIKFIPTADPTSLPKSLYTCKALVKLSLWGKFLVDVPSTACLPSLESLDLVSLVYKDQDSHVKLLSSCPVLRYLYVFRNRNCNVTRFSVKVPSLQKLTYVDIQFLVNDKRLVIDCPGLNDLHITDSSRDCFSIKNMPRLDVANFFLCTPHPNEEFLTSFSSVRFLVLAPIKVAFFSAINFSRLIDFKLRTDYLDNWLEPLMRLLHNAPKLKALMITASEHDGVLGDVPLSWNQPSSVPRCLLFQVEIFKWENFGGSREEKQFLAYILANSKCLKTASISVRSSKDNEEEKKIIKELESMYRVSASSQVLFSDGLRLRNKNAVT